MLDPSTPKAAAMSGQSEPSKSGQRMFFLFRRTQFVPPLHLLLQFPFQLQLLFLLQRLLDLLTAFLVFLPDLG